MREGLARDGIALVPGVLSAEECEQARAGVWSDMEKLAGVRRAEPATWKKVHKLLPNHGMLFQHWQLGHSDAAWAVRQNPRVVAPFAEFWGVAPDQLLCSMDGLSFSPPPETTGRGYHTSSWYHVDQRYEDAPADAPARCVQGWVTACDVRARDGTLAYLSGSHRLHGEFARAHPEAVSGTDWYKLSAKELAWYKQRGCEERMVENIAAGTLVLWDSRTVHMGRPPVRGREQPNERCVFYVCYTPRTWASQATIDKRIRYFEELRMTSHWPHRVRVFAKTPRSYGRPLPRVPALRDAPPELSELGRALVGYGCSQKKVRLE